MSENDFVEVFSFIVVFTTLELKQYNFFSQCPLTLREFKKRNLQAYELDSNV